MSDIGFNMPSDITGYFYRVAQNISHYQLSYHHKIVLKTVIEAKFFINMCTRI